MVMWAIIEILRFAYSNFVIDIGAGLNELWVSLVHNRPKELNQLPYVHTIVYYQHMYTRAIRPL